MSQMKHHTKIVCILYGYQRLFVFSILIIIKYITVSDLVDAQIATIMVLYPQSPQSSFSNGHIANEIYGIMSDHRPSITSYSNQIMETNHNSIFQQTYHSTLTINDNNNEYLSTSSNHTNMQCNTPTHVNNNDNNFIDNGNNTNNNHLNSLQTAQQQQQHSLQSHYDHHQTYLGHENQNLYPNLRNLPQSYHLVPNDMINYNNFTANDQTNVQRKNENYKYLDYWQCDSQLLPPPPPPPPSSSSHQSFSPNINQPLANLNMIPSSKSSCLSYKNEKNSNDCIDKNRGDQQCLANHNKCNNDPLQSLQKMVQIDSSNLSSKLVNKINNDPTLEMITDQIHEQHSNHSCRCGSIETASSGDSIKSSDSLITTMEGQCSSVYGGISVCSSQCSTPNNSKHNQQQQIEFNHYRNSNSIKTAKLCWWSENASSTTSNRSFTDSNNYSLSSYSCGQQQQPMAYNRHNHNNSHVNSLRKQEPCGCMCDRLVSNGNLIKKKRGRPFGSKNRRSIEHHTCFEAISTLNALENSTTSMSLILNKSSEQIINSPATIKEPQKSFMDIGINTNISIGFNEDWNHKPLLSSKDKNNSDIKSENFKVSGPVVCIERSRQNDDSPQYSIQNKKKSCSSSSLSFQSLKHLKNVENNRNIDDNICILCQKPAYFKGLGELFGSYKIPMRIYEKYSKYEDIKMIKRKSPSNSNHHFNNDEKRILRKRVIDHSHMDDDNDNGKEGINKEKPSKNDEQNDQQQLQPVWIHEDCILWSNCVYQIGPKVCNVEMAIIESIDNVCTSCKRPGATLNCFFKNCPLSPLHYLCAKEKNCDLDEEKFLLSCSLHNKRRIII